MTNRYLHARAAEITSLVSDLFETEASFVQNDSIMLRLAPRYHSGKAKDLVEDRLELAGYRFQMGEDENGLVLTVNPVRHLKIPRINIILFVVTLLSVYLVPVIFENAFIALQEVGEQTSQAVGEGFDRFDYILASIAATFDKTIDALAGGAGIEFTLALMSILIFHEMGHFIASRRRGIITSWPYFIPAPNIIGTFGAVIKSKSPFWNRRDLIEVGAAGPIAGWVLAVAWFAYGLAGSQPQLYEGGSGFDIAVGSSIITHLSVNLLVGPLPAGYYLPFTEAAFAGWVGFLVTAINMLPIGQLDGGHILYGLFRRSQFWLARVALVLLILLGFMSMMWWLFAAMGLAFGIKHPPTLNDDRPPGRTAKILGWVSLVILVLSFTPIPFVT